ncbi:uncharacterized protein ISCGN_007381 [Ixodes scapularis]
MDHIKLGKPIQRHTVRTLLYANLYENKAKKNQTYTVTHTTIRKEKTSTTVKKGFSVGLEVSGGFGWKEKFGLSATVGTKYDRETASTDTQTKLKTFEVATAVNVFPNKTVEVLWTRLAALHFNENSDREQATTQAGDLQWKFRSPKARKGHHDVNPRLTPTTYEYVTKLLVKSVTLCETAPPLREAFQLDAATPRQPCMSHGFVRPAKEDLVAARVSRFGKRAPTIAQ